MTRLLLFGLFGLFALAACGDKDTPTDSAGADADGDGHAAPADCDDADPAVHPGAAEVCNGLDDDCDGTIDLGAVDGAPFYVDADGDGAGDAAREVLACARPEGHAEVAGDCNDADAAVAPGLAEVCDGLDNNCDGLIDEDLAQVWYADGDGDGYGDDASAAETCAPDAGAVLVGGDCDDSTALASPGNTAEVCGDGVDNDCDGTAGSCIWEGALQAAGLASVHVAAGSAGEGGGQALANAGDVDGDGVDDLLLSAPYRSAERGAVWAVSLAGRSGELDAEDIAAATLTLRDGRDAAYLGWALAGGQDLDGDGRADVAVGDPYADVVASSGGAAYVTRRRISGEVLLDSNTHARIFGDTSSATLGDALALSADASGDGLPDLLVTAPGVRDSRGRTAGAVYLFEGPLDDEATASDAAGRVQPAATDTGFARAMALGDLDGDGVDDLVVGAPYQGANNRSSGAAFVFSGPLAGSLTESDRAGSLASTTSGDLLGYAVAVGDLDGDGYADLAAGAPQRNGAATYAGEVLIAFGPVSADLGLGQVDAAVRGAVSYEYLGQAIDIPGDLDGDGLADLVLGNPNASRDGSSTGALHLVYGPFQGVVSADGGGVLSGEAGWALGYRLAHGDLDGDGQVDLLATTPSWSSNNDPGGALLLQPRGL